VLSLDTINASSRVTAPRIRYAGDRRPLVVNGSARPSSDTRRQIAFMRTRRRADPGGVV
jgi:hypothetical protein